MGERPHPALSLIGHVQNALFKPTRVLRPTDPSNPDDVAFTIIIAVEHRSSDGS